jgi:hydrogenase nickel incorporation protein HypA/HybF
MHELPILRDVVKVALEHAEQAQATRILTIELQIGELRDLEESWLQRYFGFVTAGTLAENARLVVTRSKALLACDSCMSAFAFDAESQQRPACPACGSADVELASGNELRIERIEVI